MDTIEEILSQERIEDIIEELKYKTVCIRPWEELRKEYYPKLHPVWTDKSYRDIVKKNGGLVRQCRIALGLQKLAVKRIGELCFGLPVKRVYKPQTEGEKRAARILEDIFKKNRIDSLNNERSRYLYASCEFATIWYTQKKSSIYAGEATTYRLRCKSYSPMKDTEIYPRFDEYDDLIALSLAYSRKKGDTTTEYFETYTETRHLRWRKDQGGAWEEDMAPEEIYIEKIPGVYAYREEPIWEDESPNVYEAEWTLSRNGNYLRKNLKPKWVVFTDENIKFGNERDTDVTSRDVLKYPKDAKAGYETWDQAIDSLKYHIETIRQNFFSQLQLPEMSSDAMKSMPMSAESRKMIFIDGELKVTDESGLWYEAFYREINVVKAYAKKMYPSLAKDFDALSVEVVITPYQIQDEAEKVNIYTNATGKQVMSQRTAVERLGYVDDVDEEMALIQAEDMAELGEPTM